MRAHLARLLVHEPDLLMLDEPTNHLDLSTLQWFQSYLQTYPGAVLMISHDREFLNRLCTHTVDIRREQLIRYRGNYESFLEQKAAQEVQHAAAYKNQQREIARLQEFADRFRAKATKASQAQSKLKQIERMEKIDAPEDDTKSISFSFPQPRRSGLKVISLEGVAHSYGAVTVYENLNFEAERGQRIVLVGPNGAGKSTLLKLLAGVLPVRVGTRSLGINVEEAYYSQYRIEMLRPERTVLEEALDTPQAVTEVFVRSILGCFLFRGDDVFKKVDVLSGGEKSRLALVKILLNPPNLLLMDEPTTHLDMASIDALIEALKQFQGTLIFISHDVYFIRSLASHVVHVENGSVRHYPGDYSYYELKMAEREKLLALQNAPSVSAQKPPTPTNSKEQKRLEAEQRQARSKERRSQQDLVKQLEKKIEQLEKRRSELTALLEDPATYQPGGGAPQISREVAELEEQIPALTAEWEAAAEKLVQMENS
jgi:ATP-binding cassette subfamily F protein 3